MLETAHNLRHAQSTLLQIADELRRLDGRLAAVVDSIEPGRGNQLSDELRGGAQCIRTDLLSDAIDTLCALGGATEESAVRRRHGIKGAFGSLAFG